MASISPDLFKNEDGSSQVVVVTGMLNENSIAYQILKGCLAGGAHCVVTYQGDKHKRMAQRDLAKLGVDIDAKQVDVESPEEMGAFFKYLGERYERIQGLAHSIAYAPRAALVNPFVETTLEDFETAMRVSVFSLLALANRALPLMQANGGGSIIAMSYSPGARGYVAHYNVMGVAKAALETAARYLAAELGQYKIRANILASAPMRTMAGQGIPGFDDLLAFHRITMPLTQATDMDAQESLRGMAAYLLSNASRFVSGGTFEVDGGSGSQGVDVRNEAVVRKLAEQLNLLPRS